MSGSREVLLAPENTYNGTVPIPPRNIDRAMLVVDGSDTRKTLTAPIVGSTDGSLTLGTDGGGKPGILIQSSTVGRGVYLGTNEVTQIPPTVDTIWGLTFGRSNSSLTWTDHTKPAAGDFNELIWDPGLGELREERYHETGNHILDRMDRQWGSTMSYTTGLAQWSFAVTDCVWVDELQVTSWAHMKNGHLRLGGSSPGDSALVITQAAETGGGVPAGIAYTAGAHTNLQTGTHSPDVFFACARTKTHAAGALPNSSAFYVTAPTTAFAGASTVSKDYTVWFNGAPAAGANCTQTDKGALRVTGDLLVEGTSKLDATNTGYAFHAFFSATDGFRAVHNGTRSWGFDPVSGNDNVLSFGVGVIWSGLGGNVLPNLLMRAGYGADATYPAMNLENRNAATNVLEHWGPAIVEKHRAWNTGGTPASEEWVWTSQKTSVQGAPSTAFYDVKAARAGGAAQNVLHLPGQAVALTGVLDSATTVAELKATVRNLVNIVKAALPFITDSTT